MSFLSDLQLGETAIIQDITIQNLADRQKLFACGLLPGAAVTVVRVAPLGDPLQIQVDDDLLLSIRKSEGYHVKVDSPHR